MIINAAYAHYISCSSFSCVWNIVASVRQRLVRLLGSYGFMKI